MQRMPGGLDMSHDIIKEIIATFLKVNIQDIVSSTRVDNEAIKGSILVHRMYSELKKNGYEVSNPAGIKTFGDLEKELLGIDNSEETHCLIFLRIEFCFFSLNCKICKTCLSGVLFIFSVNIWLNGYHFWCQEIIKIRPIII